MIIDRNTMTDWVIEALREMGGSGTILDICKKVWQTHGTEISNSGDFFYKWQYEIRWAGDILRKEGMLRSVGDSPKGIWVLADQ